MLDKWYFEELDKVMERGFRNGRLYKDTVLKDFNLCYRITFVPTEEGLRVYFDSRTLDTDPWDWSVMEYRGMIYWNEMPKEYENEIRAK